MPDLIVQTPVATWSWYKVFWCDTFLCLGDTSCWFCYSKGTKIAASVANFLRIAMHSVFGNTFMAATNHIPIAKQWKTFRNCLVTPGYATCTVCVFACTGFVMKKSHFSQYFDVMMNDPSFISLVYKKISVGTSPGENPVVVLTRDATCSGKDPCISIFVCHIWPSITQVI